MAMFPEPCEFVEKEIFVVIDKKCPWPAYWCEEKNKWSGLIDATKYTTDVLAIPDQGTLVTLKSVLGMK